MILREIAQRTRSRVAELKKIKSMGRMEAEAASRPGSAGFPFEKALGAEDISFICEVKKASPSKGIIAEEFPYLSIAKEYEDAGAAALSVLTEPFYFMGSAGHLAEIAESAAVPVLRKDFIVDPYQIFESKCLGASAVLLICALHGTDALKEFITIAHGLGLSALVEAHAEDEVESALKAGARIIGINNRDLKTFEVDMETSVRMAGMIPENVLFVSESGIGTAEDIALLRRHKADAVLIGEALMRSPDKKRRLAILRGC